MEKQNITLSLPKELLLKVKHIAIDKNTSVSGLLTQTLKEIVLRDESYRKARDRQIYLMENGFTMGVAEEKSWKREDLYDRN
jgi:hypothetical protein